jgi:hypothetical protein
MQTRRNDLDVTNRVQTTDPASIKTELNRLFRLLYRGACHSTMDRALQDLVRLYRGEFPGYLGCDTSYHDLQHVLDVTLAMARMMDGYERSRNGTPALGVRLFQLGVVVALFHDVGYLRKARDKKAKNGAQYTLVHVTRGAHFLKDYLPEIGFGEFAAVAGEIIHYTGFEKAVAEIKIRDPLMRLLGSLLGTADIIAQMADRCYLEKCRDRLYPEFVAGGIAAQVDADGKEKVVFASGEDLVQKTPGFFETAVKRLDTELDGAHHYAASHFGGNNLYIEAAARNVSFAKQLGKGDRALRRTPPDPVTAGSKEK